MKRKLSDLDFIERINENDADIYMFSETWLSSSEQLNLDIQGYTCDHLYGNKSAGAKRGRYSGGISIYYKNYLKNSIHIVEKNQCGVVWVKIQNDVFSFQEDVYICNVYIPPSNSKVYGVPSGSKVFI